VMALIDLGPHRGAVASRRQAGRPRVPLFLRFTGFGRIVTLLDHQLSHSKEGARLGAAARRRA